MSCQGTGAPMAPDTEDGYVRTPAWGMFMVRILGPRPADEECAEFHTLKEDQGLIARAA